MMPDELTIDTELARLMRRLTERQAAGCDTVSIGETGPVLMPDDILPRRHGWPCRKRGDLRDILICHDGTWLCTHLGRLAIFEPAAVLDAAQATGEPPMLACPECGQVWSICADGNGGRKARRVLNLSELPAGL